MTHSYRIAAWLPDPPKLRETVDALERAGFDRSQFGVLGRKSLFDSPLDHDASSKSAATRRQARKQGNGGAFRNILVDGLGYAGAIIAARSVVLAGGGLGVALLATAATAATGGLVRALLAHGFEPGLAKTLDLKIGNGGLLLWIDARDRDQNIMALNRLTREGADIADAIEPGFATATSCAQHARKRGSQRDTGERSADRRALTRWDNEGGAVNSAHVPVPVAAHAKQNPTPANC